MSDMPLYRWDNCPGCGDWSVLPLEGLQEEYYCFYCWNEWLYWEKKWAKTTDCMLMLAAKSLSRMDNPK